MPPGIPQPRQWTRRDWARYQAFKRRMFIKRRRLVEMFEQSRDLYGSGWEVVEVSLIRDECEDIGLPMGYGRVGRPPVQLTWGIATPTNPLVDWMGFDGGLESVDEEA